MSVWIISILLLSISISSVSRGGEFRAKERKKKEKKNWPLTTSHKALIVYCSENSNANESNEGENGIAVLQLMQCGDLLRFMNEINEVSV